MGSCSQRHSLFLGRWRVFHDGHKALINSVWERTRRPVLVLVMDTEEDPPYFDRVGPIYTWAQENGIPLHVMIVPPVGGVYYGRDVGYEVQQIGFPPEVEQISATKLLATGGES